MSGSVVCFVRSQLRSEAYLDPVRIRPVLDRLFPLHPLPEPYLTKPISEHRHSFCEPKYPSVASNAPTGYVHAPA